MFELLFPEYRLDWFGAGPSSPNKTGALLAILFVVSWLPALRFRWGFWLSLPLAFIASVFLLQTESRGALVAAGAALALLAGFYFFLWRQRVEGNTLSFQRQGDATRAAEVELCPPVNIWLRICVGVCALVALVVYSSQLGVNDRMVAITSGEDGSSNVRVALYSAGLQMIAAAPNGWGRGEAGSAYGQWYQEIGDNRSYLSLVNSHLTWMVEYGMVFQFLYISGWCFALMFCWPRPSSPLRAVTFATWVTLGLCGFFSSVLTLVWLWIIPSFLLLFCLFQSYRLKLWPSKRQRLTASFSVIGCMLVLQSAAYASAAKSPLISASPDSVEIGEDPSQVAIIQPDYKILGNKYGHTIREYLNEMGGFTVLNSDLSQVNLGAFDTVVLSGDSAPSKLNSFRGRTLWMNPPVVSEATLEMLKDQSLTIIIGSLGDWRRARVWQSLVDESPNWDLIELRGVANFIPNWPRYLLTKED